jgi:outer membrane protein
MTAGVLSVIDIRRNCMARRLRRFASHLEDGTREAADLSGKAEFDGEIVDLNGEIAKASGGAELRACCPSRANRIGTPPRVAASHTTNASLIGTSDPVQFARLFHGASCDFNETLQAAVRSTGLSRRNYMTAVRRLISIACLAIAMVASAQQPQTTQTAPVPRVTEPVTADTDKDVNDPNALKLSLDDAVRLAIKQNLGIELSRYDYSEAGQSLNGSWGIFDPLATANLAKARSQNAATSSLQGSGSGSTTANVGLTQLIPTGGDYSVTFNNRKSTSAGGFGTALTPSYTSSLGFAFTQPLARDFGIDITKRGIYIARNTLGIDRELFRTSLIETSNAVEQAYLNLVYQRRFVDVVKESLFLARDQARITQIRIDVGASAPLDILQPRVQIATSEEALISAVAQVRDAEDQLRALLNLPPADWSRPILPTDSVAYTPVTIDTESSIARAYELRPEIRENRLTIDIRRIQHLFARNQVLPRVDAVLGYNAAGAAGRTVNLSTGQPVPDVPQTRYSDALRQIFNNDFYGWSVGLNFSVPIFNISQRAEARRTELDYERSKVADAQTRQNVAVDVRSTARAIDTAAKEITASKTAREAAEQNLDAERKRYENGMTTNFQVLQVQQQLSDARANEIQALVAYNKDIVLFHRAVGDLLDVLNIQVEEPAAVNEPSFFSRFDRYNWLNYQNQVDREDRNVKH